jgi:hypothetical protein
MYFILSIYIYYIYIYIIYIYIHVIPCPYTSLDSDLTISAGPSIFWAFAAPALLSAPPAEVPPVLGGVGAMDPMDPMGGAMGEGISPTIAMDVNGLWFARLWVIEQNHNQNGYSLDV